MGKARLSKTNIQFQERIILSNVSVANNYWLKLTGYMFRSRPHVSAILFESSGSLQTTFMSFELDAVFLNQDNVITKIQKNIKPWRLVLSAPKSCRVLEVPAGVLPSDMKVGDSLLFV